MDRLPEHAKRVFRGVYHEVWQWEQGLYDGSTAVFEALKRPNTVSVIATVGEEIIVEEQQQPDSEEAYLSLPEGRMDRSDDPLEEAKRELLEETGYASDDWEPWREIAPSRRVVWKQHFFLARNCRYAQAPRLDAGEKIRLKRFSFEEFLALSDDPLLRGDELVKMLLRMRIHPDLREDFRTRLFRA